MTRYFFHTASGERHIDEEGSELIDDAAAQLEAVRLAGAIMYDQPGLLLEGRDYRVEVTAPTGNLLFTVVIRAIHAAAA